MSADRNLLLGRARVGLRIARREVLRRPWRSTLVLLLVLVPTMVMTVGIASFRTAEWSAEEERAAVYGTADAEAVQVIADPNGAPLEIDLLDELGYVETTTAPSDAQMAALQDQLPEGSSVLVERLADDRIVVGDSRAFAQVSDLDVSDPMVEGRFGRFEGHKPLDGAEAVITEELADDLGIGVDDEITPDRLGRTMTVVGVVAELDGHDRHVFTGGAVGAEASTVVRVDLPGVSSASGAAADLARFPELALGSGWDLYPAQVDGTDNTEAVGWTYVLGGVALVVLATIVAAAFAVGARRQMHTIGLVSATGAPVSAVGWMLVAQGVVLGAVGSLLGVALGVGIVHLLPLWVLDIAAGRPVAGAVTPLADLAPVVVIGTAVAAGAAWLPSRSAARVPVLQALAGRRPLPRVPARLPVFGLVSLGLGCLAFGAAAGSVAEGSGGSTARGMLAVVGALAVLVGVLASTPWIVAGLERRSAGRSAPVRLAGRALARNRVRSTAVVAAIVAVLATVLGASTIYQSAKVEPQLRGADGTVVFRSPDLPYLQDDLVVVTGGDPTTAPDGSVESTELRADVLERVREVLPDAVQTEVPIVADRAVQEQRPSDGAVSASLSTSSDLAVVPGGPDRLVVELGGEMALATPDVIDLFEVPDDLRDRLAEGGAVAVVDAGPDAAAIIQRPPLELPEGDEPPDLEDPDLAPPQDEVPLVGSFDSPVASSGLPLLLLDPGTAEQMDLVARTGRNIVFQAPEALSASQRDRLDLLAEEVSWESQAATSPDTTSIFLGDEPAVVPEALVYGALLLVALLLVLVVVAIGLSLAAKDAQDERLVLEAVGAPPRTLRRVGTRRAVLLVGVAALVAVPSGLLPAAAMVLATNRTDGFDLRLDLWALLFVLVVLPLVVGGVTSFGGWVRDLLRPTRPDVLALGD